MDRQHPFVKAIAGAMKQRCLVRPGSTLLVAVSGGADSTALLRALHELAPRRQWHLALVACHVQHHLRQPQGEADARFVADLCATLELRLIRHDLSPPADGGNVEAWARRARYAALEQAARACDADAILTAHHGDDLLETLLMRLLRGSSPRGLSGMAWRRRLSPACPLPLCRPMLGVTHQQAEDYLRSIEQSWQIDHTNQDTTRLRAALRHRVLPVLRDVAPHAASQALAVSMQQRAMAHAMKQSANLASAGMIRGNDTGWTLGRTSARQWPGAIVATLLRDHLLQAGVPADRLNHRQIAQLTRAVRDAQGHHRTYAFAGQVSATLDKTTLTIHKPAG